MRRFLSVAVVAVLMASGCGNTNDKRELSEDKKQIIQADANGLDVCTALGLPANCDLCLELGYYGDGICDIAMILHGLCEGPDPDCSMAETDCANGLDDDMDGLVDCGDSDCAFTPACMSACGDGVVDPTEECDDGNSVNGDGCSNICMLENTSPSELCDNGLDDDLDGLVDCSDPDCVNAAACGATCGNGIVEVGEECDDGNSAPGDGCSAACTLETVNPETNCMDRVDNDLDGLVDCADPDCASDTFCLCGNGVVEAAEECDDGNNTDGDGCSSSCLIESAVELCDDGMDNDMDGLVDCADPDCTGNSACSVCGNGVVEAGEQCDDGNVALGDGCDDRCMIESMVEVCNDSVDNDMDGLVDCADPDCANNPACGSTPMCGNGIVEAGEQCDDGNSAWCDGCTPTCMSQPTAETSCSDGIDEDCDGAIDCADSDCAGAPGCP